MSYDSNMLSMLILLTCFVLVANKRPGSYILTFRLQSLLVALTAGIMALRGVEGGKRMDLLIVCVIILGLKVFYIPGLLNKTFGKVEYRVEKDFFLNIPLLVLISCGLVIFSYFTLSSIDVMYSEDYFLCVVGSVSVVLTGLFFMITRKKAIGQIVGFLVIENGLFVTAIFSTDGMPIVIDLGIFIDLITAVLIMGLMVFRINEKFESIDINKLRRLRG